MSECDECPYECDEFRELESTNAILARRVSVLEKMVIDEWLSERGLQRMSNR